MRNWVWILALACGLAPAVAGPVRINELMALNTATRTDPQGEYADWIELYNPTDHPVDLAGLYLTDDPNQPRAWRFALHEPARTTVAARGYLLVWADGDTGAAGLHTNFRLSAAGEAVALVDTDGVTVLDAVTFPVQHADIAYGRYPDGAPAWRLLDSPSPGAANRTTTEGFVAAPRISVPSRLFTEPLTVEITCDTEGAVIYYTQDGSDPRGQALRPGRRYRTTTYTGPLSIRRSTTLRAVAVREGWRDSPVAGARYEVLSAGLRSFTSDLPLLLLEPLAEGIGTEATPAVCFLFEPHEGTTRLGLTPDLRVSCGVNIRGQSSANFPKKQYHLETWDAQQRDAAVAWLGLPADADWVLNGPYSDKSLMRNALVYRWARDMGHYAPRTRFLEVFLGGSGDALSLDDTLGVYCLTEKIKIAPDRVALAALHADDADEPNITGGYLIKKDKDPTQEDVHFVTSTGQNLIYADPPGHALTAAQRAWIRDYLDRFEAALYGPLFADPVQGYAPFVDVDSWVDLHLLVELTKNIDGYRLSTYFSKDRNGKLTAGPAWDYNLSLGNADYLEGWDPEGWYFNPHNPRSHPWWPRLFEDPAFRLRYADRWFAFRRGVLATDRLLATIDGFAAELHAAQQRNFVRWPVLGRYVWPNGYVAATYAEEIAWMKDWLQARVAWMDAAIAREDAPAPVTFSQQGGPVDTGYALGLSAPAGAVSIYYSLDGTDPRQLEADLRVLVDEGAPKRVRVATGPIPETWKQALDFPERGWLTHEGLPGGVGYDTRGDYAPFLGLDLTELMAGRVPGCYLRSTFSLDVPPEELDTVTLNLRYDDGFVAYLNGHEIARAHAGAAPAWDATATASRSEADAVSRQAFPVADLGVLQPGRNLLALHGLNRSAASSDFLIDATLTATRKPAVDEATAVRPYTGPIRLSASAHVKARSWSDGRWSALNEAVFSVGPLVENLRVTELMYHPPDLGEPHAADTEFVELANVGAETINLHLVQFTAGIEAVLPAANLAPGACVLLVRDRDAFAARYGSDLPVIGTYTGRLSNGGERLTLRDAVGRVLCAGRYDDTWFPSTDGGGHSLVLRSDALADPNALGRPQAWQPSLDLLGTPGTWP